MGNCDFLCQNCGKMQFSLLNFCSQRELFNVNEAKIRMTVEKGDILFSEGQPLNYLYCLESGQVKIVKKAPNDRTMIMRWATPGDFIGYRAVLINKPYSATAMVTEDSTLCRIPVDLVWEIFESNTEFRDAALEVMCKSLEETENRMTDLAYRPVLGRIAEAILTFKDNEYKKGLASRLAFEINRKDLASMTGTVKETVIRSIQTLKKDGVISTQGSKIFILDEEKLAKISKLYD